MPAARPTVRRGPRRWIAVVQTAASLRIGIVVVTGYPSPLAKPDGTWLRCDCVRRFELDRLARGNGRVGPQSAGDRSVRRVRVLQFAQPTRLRRTLDPRQVDRQLVWVGGSGPHFRVVFPIMATTPTGPRDHVCDGDLRDALRLAAHHGL